MTDLTTDAASVHATLIADLIVLLVEKGVIRDSEARVLMFRSAGFISCLPDMRLERWAYLLVVERLRKRLRWHPETAELQPYAGQIDDTLTPAERVLARWPDHPGARAREVDPDAPDLEPPARWPRRTEAKPAVEPPPDAPAPPRRRKPRPRS